MSILRRHPLIAFFVLTYALTWSIVPFGLFFTPGPLIAAFIVVMLTQGRAGLREWGSRLIRWRVRWPWYAIAIAVPIAVLAMTTVINISLGAGRPSLTQLAPGSIVMIFAVRLINPMDGPMAEEPGWRAFAQPRLQRGRSPFRATAILSLLVASWHLPLWLLPKFGATPVDIASDFIGTIAVTFWYAWLFNHSAGSALLTLIAHAAEGVVHPQLFWSDPAVAARTTWLYAGVWCAVAIALLALDQKFWRNAEQAKSMPTQPGPTVEEVTETSDRHHPEVLRPSEASRGRVDRTAPGSVGL
jgi:uncharacterized protein